MNTEPNNDAGEGCPAVPCSALFDLLMEQIDAARKRSDLFEKQCREEENDIA